MNLVRRTDIYRGKPLGLFFYRRPGRQGTLRLLSQEEEPNLLASEPDPAEPDVDVDARETFFED